MAAYCPALVLALLTALVSGCASNPETRIMEKSTAFLKLDASDQDLIREGVIDVGFTTDMVYMALGRPSEIRESARITAPGTAWVYRKFFPPTVETPRKDKPLVGGMPGRAGALGVFSGGGSHVQGHGPMLDVKDSGRSPGSIPVLPELTHGTLTVIFDEGRVSSFAFVP